MRNMKMSKKLITGFGIIVILACAIGVAGIIGLITLDTADDYLYYNQTKPLSDIAHIIDNVQRTRVELRGLAIFSGNDDKIKTIEANLDNLFLILDEFMETYTDTSENGSAAKPFAKALNIYENIFKSDAAEVLGEAKSGASQMELLESINVKSDDINLMVDSLNECLEIHTSEAQATTIRNKALTHKMLTIIITVIIVTIISAIFLAIYISGLVSKPLTEMNKFLMRLSDTGNITLTQHDIENIGRYSTAKDEIGHCATSCANFVYRMSDVSQKLETMAQGDLSIEVKVLSDEDSFGIALNKLIDNYNEMFNMLRLSSSQVSVGAEQIAQGAQSLASGSVQQSASIQEFSSSLTQLEEKTKSNADNSYKAKDANTKTGQQLDESMQSMSKMLEAMRQIDESSKKIRKIIKVIDEIAFQTNILALNASVEAAHAGRQGLGFAVVADEVRRLAIKSVEAAEETAGLIEGSSVKVEEGSKIVNQTNDNLKTASQYANELALLVDSMADASVEQARVIEEMNKGMEQISVVVETNSSTAQESAAAAQQMSAQSTSLSDFISKYKLKQVDHKYTNTAVNIPEVSFDIEDPEHLKQIDMSGNFGKY